VFVAAHYGGDFTGVLRVTIVATRDGIELRRFDDVPVAPGVRVLHVLLRGDVLRKMPSGVHTVSVRAGERVLAEYTFRHAGFQR